MSWVRNLADCAGCGGYTFACLLRAGIDEVRLSDKHGRGLLVMTLRAQRQRSPALGVELLGVFERRVVGTVAAACAHMLELALHSLALRVEERQLDVVAAGELLLVEEDARHLGVVALCALE